ncbi:MAG: serine/threonine-protein phosphatase [Methanomicrobiales archaeon]|nr:serine/threonine-protein phosphatase [Methanomicrobiales archaeon]
MLAFHAASVPGRRKRNEDAYFAGRIGRFTAFAVADGMGGHAAGDRASGYAIEQFRETVAGSRIDEAAEAITSRAFAAANDAIYAFNQENRLNAGTTLVTLLVDEDGACVFGNIGDSRATIFSENRTWQTDDHSLVNQMVKNGQILPEEAWMHPQRNILVQALGLAPRITPDLYRHARAGGTVVLSSDGLHDTLRPGRIRTIVSAYSPESAVAALIDECLREGASDNITVIVIRVLS